MPQRKFSSLFFGAALTMTVMTTGCRPHHDHRDHDDQPAQAQPVQNETTIYNQWEVETHRPHKEIAQRPAEEQKEYHDWRLQHPDHR
jgi:hypothetical protein